MRYKSAHALMALALSAFAALSSAQARQQGQQSQEPQQQQDEKVIEDFVTTRGVSFDTPKTSKPKASTQPQRRNSAGGSTASKSSGGSSASTKKGATTPGTKKGSAQAGSADVTVQGGAAVDGGGSDGGAVADGAKILDASTPGPIALGYTVYMKDAEGALFAVDPSREYRTGDHVALTLETNTDGYLYIFDAENGKDAMMLYPNVLLDGGSNAIGAHVRETYPTDVGDAFVLTPPAATEHLYIVVSREPLAGVPTGEALAKFCAERRGECYWRPTAEQWARIVAGAGARGIVEAKSAQIAQADTHPVATGSLARGIKIKRTEPSPSVVRVSDSPAAKMLVTKIEIKHK
jgi:Domain of unknown function (DUF4384)